MDRVCFKEEKTLNMYGGHAATLLVYFIFWGARAEKRTRGCLTAAGRATCGLRRHPHVDYVATLSGLRCHPVGYVATLVGYVATLVGYVATLMGYVATLRKRLIFLKIRKKFSKNGNTLQERGHLQYEISEKPQDYEQLETFASGGIETF